MLAAEVLEMAATTKIIKKPSQKKRNSAAKRVVSKSSLGSRNTYTSFYASTSLYTLKSWGGFFPDIELHVEQVKKNLFVYNYKGSIGKSQVFSAKNEDTKKHEYWLQIGKDRFYFKKPVEDASYYYNTPSIELLDQFIAGKYTPRPFNKIIDEAIRVLNVLYDFKFTADKTIWKLHIGQSHVVPVLDSTFYNGVDATFGGGKTTLIELASILKRHGFMAGDISAASIPRLTDEFSLNISFDEIDQHIGDGESPAIAILRKGQRRGNPYIRCEGRNFTPKAYDVLGAHDYTYRSETEDAFASRSMKTHTAVTTDNKLPVLNIYKRKFLKKFADELFLWDVQNLLEIAKKRSSFYTFEENSQIFSSCSNVEGCSSTLETKKIREELYNKLTSHLDKETIDILSKLAGRNTEIAFIAFDVANLLDIDVSEDLKQVMETKQQDEEISDNYYKDSLEEFLITILNKCDLTLKEGLNDGCRFYPKNLAYQEFIQKLVDLKIATIGTKRFTSLLRDIGFVEHESIQSQRYLGPPKQCLIFTKKILERLAAGERDPRLKESEIEEEAVLTEEEQEELIHHKCYICGETPCITFNKVGKPICKSCKEADYILK